MNDNHVTIQTPDERVLFAIPNPPTQPKATIEEQEEDLESLIRQQLHTADNFIIAAETRRVEAGYAVNLQAQAAAKCEVEEAYAHRMRLDAALNTLTTGR